MKTMTRRSDYGKSLRKKAKTILLPIDSDSHPYSFLGKVCWFALLLAFSLGGILQAQTVCSDYTSNTNSCYMEWRNSETLAGPLKIDLPGKYLYWCNPTGLLNYGFYFRVDEYIVYHTADLNFNAYEEIARVPASTTQYTIPSQYLEQGLCHYFIVKVLGRVTLGDGTYVCSISGFTSNRVEYCPFTTTTSTTLSTTTTSTSVSTSTSTTLPYSTVIRLNGNRFEVSVQWTNYNDGTTGLGWGVPLTADSGYFWFFNPANIELMIKVLDGRAINGHFWVMYGALSDVQYSILVRDTLTGATKSYFNPAHKLASGVDVQAFP